MEESLLNPSEHVKHRSWLRYWTLGWVQLRAGVADTDKLSSMRMHTSSAAAGFRGGSVLGVV